MPNGVSVYATVLVGRRLTRAVGPWHSNTIYLITFHTSLTKAFMNQAWLVTRFHLENHTVVDTFLALLDAAIPSAAMLRISEELYQSSIHPSQSSIPRSENAQYRILNDGSPHTGYIVCGHNPGIDARLVYEIVIKPETNQSYTLHWREAHIVIQDGIRNIEYWEDFSVTMSLVSDRDTLLETHHYKNRHR